MSPFPDSGGWSESTEVIEYRNGLGPLAAPLAAGYGAGVLLRRWAYDKRLLPIAKASAFTVSVGGLEAGGSGKTPVTDFLLGAFEAAGAHAGLVSRGYGRETQGLVVREPGESVTASVVGDEPALLASRHAVPVAVCAQRREAADALIALGCDTLVLDDGFAHRALDRDVEIVVLRGDAPFGAGHLLPWGNLREPPSSLSRANVLWFHFKSGRVPSEEVEASIAKLTADWCKQDVAVVTSVAVARPPTTLCGTQLDLHGARVLAATGIARPSEFEASLKREGAIVTELVSFRDHHAFTAQDVQRLAKRVQKARADALVVTPKDAIKLSRLWQEAEEETALWVQGTRVRIVSGMEGLAGALKLHCGSLEQAASAP